MAVMNKFNIFTQDILTGVHNFTSNTFKVALSNTAPVATNTGLVDITQIAASGGYTAGGYALDSVTLSQTAGVSKVVVADETITAAGGAIGPFRYIVIYNDTAVSDKLIGWYDYGSSITLNDGDSITLDFDNVNGIFDIT